MELSCWEWKREPVSPPQLYAEDTQWFIEDSDDLTAFQQLSHCAVKNENKAEVVSKLLDDLEQLDQLDDFIKDEEPFSNWLEEKVDLPIFDNIRIEPQIRYKSEELKPIVPQDTNSLLQEFETVYDAVELTHGQLTPPQSPPLVVERPLLLTTLTPLTNTISQNVYFQPLTTTVRTQTQGAAATSQIYYQSIRPNSIEISPATPQPDVARELAVVDELVRSRAENLCSWDEESATTPSSPSSSSSDCLSDPEWIPEPVQNSSSAPGPERPARGRKRAGKGGFGPEDKKSRKKEQNKNAATRYRMKKKQEVEVILSEEKTLMDYNDDLQGKVTDLQREIKYLKGLMRDLFKAKGLIQ